MNALSLVHTLENTLVQQANFEDKTIQVESQGNDRKASMTVKLEIEGSEKEFRIEFKEIPRNEHLRLVE